jgi:chromosome segregation ATPase
MKGKHERLDHISSLIVYGNMYASGALYLNHSKLLEAKQNEIRVLTASCQETSTRVGSSISTLEEAIEQKKAITQNVEDDLLTTREKITHLTKSIADKKTILESEKPKMQILQQEITSLRSKLSFILQTEIPQCHSELLALDTTVSSLPKSDSASGALAKLNKLQSELHEVCSPLYLSTVNFNT